MTSRSTPMSAGHVVASTRIFLFVPVAILLALSLISIPALAQTTAGRVLGTVTDQSGAAVAGATVVVTDTQRGTVRTLTTDSSGEYVAADLIPGTYKIRVEAKGFKTVERPSVAVEVATDVRADLTLQPGNVSEVITVSAEVPLVNSISSTLGGTLSNKEINDLPLNGRNYENLLQLRPGVMRYPGGGFSTTSTDGLRAEDNAYFVEGLFNSEPFSGQGIINGAGIAGDSATILPIDAIQEFNVQENPPAEYGWKPGAVVNVGLKSGTNKIHGSAFAFGRDGVMDARNYFNDAPAPKNPRTLEQFGGSFGGAIVKDRAFFFGAYEGQRYDVGNSYSVTTPSMQPLTLAPGTPPNCTAPALAGLDCNGSIPNAIADLLANGYTVGHQRPLYRTLYQSSQPINLGLHCLCNWYGNLQRNRLPSKQHARHQHRAGISQQCWRRQRAWQSGFQHQSAQRHQRHVFLWEQQRNGRGFSRVAIQMAIRHPHSRSGRRRELGLDSQRTMGE